MITPAATGRSFGGNPLAVAERHAVVGLLETGSTKNGSRPGRSGSGAAGAPGRQEGITEVRTVGLWAGSDLDRRYCRCLQAPKASPERGVLRRRPTTVTDSTAPPLIITEEELDWMLDQFEAVLDAATATH